MPAPSSAPRPAGPQARLPPSLELSCVGKPPAMYSLFDFELRWDCTSARHDALSSGVAFDNTERESGHG